MASPAIFTPATPVCTVAPMSCETEAVLEEPAPTPLPDPKSYLRSKIADDRVFALALEIVKREGGWNDPKICNRVSGCTAGQGHFQVIFSTERTCEKYFGREMSMLDSYDNIDCGVWLLTERGVKAGIGHWDNFGIPLNGKNWGSGPYQLSKFGL